MSTRKERENNATNVNGEGINNSFWGQWIDRTRFMRQWITEDINSVMDLGAGGMYLKKMIPSNISYFPVDYTSRCPETIVCDFNKHEFPDLKVDCCYCGGILEYVEDTEWFLEKIKETDCKFFLLSYSIKLDGQTRESRSGNGWVNDFTFIELLDLVYAHGFILTDWNKHYDFSPLLKFEIATPKNLTKNYFCTGCSACENICEKKAIKMQPDCNGFIKPVFDKNSCINCGKCLKVCPILHRKYQETFSVHSYMAMADDDTRKLSSNGGTFSILAREVFSKKGVVFGAAWDSDFSVHHIAIKTEKELDSLRKSKYLQSKIEDSYKQTKRLLDDGCFVLFSGTPCQIQGLKLFLGKEYVNLITVDILCHYVPSPKVFKQYLDENFGIENINAFTFRDKEKGWNPTLMKIEKKDGSIKYRDFDNDFLKKGFHSRLFMNEACENCKFADFPRVGDISIGDFWGGVNNQTYNDGKGTGEIIVNTQKGDEFLENIKNNFYRLEEIPVEITFENRIKKYYPIHIGHDHFLRLLKNNSFNYAVECALDRKFQIGLVGDLAVENYGANITYYALYQVLTEQLGYDVLLIERPIEAPWKLKDSPTCFMQLPYPKYAVEPYTDKISMKHLNYRCEKFLVGSDQCWNNNLYYLFGEFITLDWVHDNKLKVAYAASFGTDYFSGSDYDRAKISLFMKKFDAFSVREKTAVPLVKNEFGVEATHVLDPVFLCSKGKYIELAKIGGYYELEKENFLFSYILDLNEDIIDSLKLSSELLGLSNKIVTDIAKNTVEDNLKWKDKNEVVYSSNVENWLANIICCEYMITDSFHGICFAIIFHKPFIAIINKKRGATRFHSILQDLELENRLVENCKDISKKLLFENINWNNVDLKLEKLVQKSLSWLDNALKIEKKASLSEYDVNSERIDNLAVKLEQLDGFIQQRSIDIDNFAKGTIARLDAVDVNELNLNHFTEYVNTRFQTIDNYANEVNKHIADLESQNRLQRLIQRAVRKFKRTLFHKK